MSTTAFSLYTATQGKVLEECSPCAMTDIAWKDDNTPAYGTESIMEFSAVYMGGKSVTVPYDTRFDDFVYVQDSHSCMYAVQQCPEKKNA